WPHRPCWRRGLVSQDDARSFKWALLGGLAPQAAEFGFQVANALFGFTGLFLGLARLFLRQAGLFLGSLSGFICGVPGLHDLLVIAQLVTASGVVTDDPLLAQPERQAERFQRQTSTGVQRDFHEAPAAPAVASDLAGPVL